MASRPTTTNAQDVLLGLKHHSDEYFSLLREIGSLLEQECLARRAIHEHSHKEFDDLHTAYNAEIQDRTEGVAAAAQYKKPALRMHAARIAHAEESEDKMQHLRDIVTWAGANAYMVTAVVREMSLARRVHGRSHVSRTPQSSEGHFGGKDPVRGHTGSSRPHDVGGKSHNPWRTADTEARDEEESVDSLGSAIPERSVRVVFQNGFNPYHAAVQQAIVAEGKTHGVHVIVGDSRQPQHAEVRIQFFSVDAKHGYMGYERAQEIIRMHLTVGENGFLTDGKQAVVPIIVHEGGFPSRNRVGDAFREARTPHLVSRVWELAETDGVVSFSAHRNHDVLSRVVVWLNGIAKTAPQTSQGGVAARGKRGSGTVPAVPHTWVIPPMNLGPVPSIYQTGQQAGYGGALVGETDPSSDYGVWKRGRAGGVMPSVLRTAFYNESGGSHAPFEAAIIAAAARESIRVEVVPPPMARCHVHFYDVPPTESGPWETASAIQQRFTVADITQGLFYREKAVVPLAIHSIANSDPRVMQDFFNKYGRPDLARTVKEVLVGGASKLTDARNTAAINDLLARMANVDERDYGRAPPVVVKNKPRK